MSDTFELSIEEMLPPQKEIIITIDGAKHMTGDELRELVAALEASGAIFDDEARVAIEARVALMDGGKA